MSIELAKKNFFPNYNPAPFIISHAKGSWIYDQEGQKYLDFSTGIAVSNLGHCPDAVVQAIQEQAAKLIHSSNMYWNQPSMKLAERLVELSFAEQVFFCNSGTEANEAALKLARKYFFDKGQARTKFLSFENAFHGRTFGSMSATSKEKYREPFQPVVPGFEFAPFNEMSSLEKINEEVAAVLIEPVQGEGGIHPAHSEFLRALRKRCDESGTLLIMDCIQVGFMRTGNLFGYEDLGITPDMISLAKGLGNGVPIGALLTRAELAKSFGVGAHGTTFGGNPIACAAALAVLDEMTRSDFRSHLENITAHIWNALEKKIRPHSKVKDVRGKGMMIGIELKDKIDPVFEKLRDSFILTTRIQPSIFRVLPPLNCSIEEIDLFVEKLQSALDHAN